MVKTLQASTATESSRNFTHAITWFPRLAADENLFSEFTEQSKMSSLLCTQSSLYLISLSEHRRIISMSQ